MTDKEWKELCNWAESLKNNRIKIIDYNYNKRFISFCGPSVKLRFYKGGYIYTAIGCLRRNRTSQQIKTIIENLL